MADPHPNTGAVPMPLFSSEHHNDTGTETAEPQSSNQMPTFLAAVVHPDNP
ncbi:hypothetical protein [Nocardia sp. NPDC058666]|uniref:hypothetical protein n=1 Tax=unclassified Nocardia TaxID=2637762 RepID=UPI0036574A61